MYANLYAGVMTEEGVDFYPSGNYGNDPIGIAPVWERINYDGRLLRENSRYIVENQTGWQKTASFAILAHYSERLLLVTAEGDGWYEAIHLGGRQANSAAPLSVGWDLSPVPPVGSNILLTQAIGGGFACFTRSENQSHLWEWDWTGKFAHGQEIARFVPLSGDYVWAVGYPRPYLHIQYGTEAEARLAFRIERDSGEPVSALPLKWQSRYQACPRSFEDFAYKFR